MNGRKGFTFIEMMIAGAILGIIAFGALVGVVRLSKFAEEQTELLAADGFCWDMIWKLYNEDFSTGYDLRDPDNPQSCSVAMPSITVTAAELPALCKDDWAAPVCYVTASNRVDASTGKLLDEGVFITVNLEWGPTGARRILIPRSGMASGTKVQDHPVTVFRSKLQRDLYREGRN